MCQCDDCKHSEEAVMVDVRTQVYAHIDGINHQIVNTRSSELPGGGFECSARGLCGFGCEDATMRAYAECAGILGSLMRRYVEAIKNCKVDIAMAIADRMDEIQNLAAAAYECPSAARAEKMNDTSSTIARSGLAEPSRMFAKVQIWDYGQELEDAPVFEVFMAKRKGKRANILDDENKLSVMVDGDSSVYVFAGAVAGACEEMLDVVRVTRGSRSRQ